MRREPLWALFGLSLLLGAMWLVGGVWANSVSSPDTAGDVGQHTSLVLDGAGNPVVAYHDAGDGSLKILHCNDPLCVGGDESITTPDADGLAGLHTSLALDSNGFPVVAYHDGLDFDLKIMRCNDVNCAGGDESITGPDWMGNVGQYASLALDGDGNPVVAYYDATNADLKVMHCYDQICDDVDAISITSPDTVGDVGQDSSLLLDADGNPVISYFDDTNETLKVIHCNDPDCAGGDESITTPDVDGVGGFTSLELDGAGNPVVAYFDFDVGALRVMHCNDPDCANGGENVTTVLSTIGLGPHLSLALGGDGFPVVAYYDGLDFDLKLMICNDANCAGDDELILTPDSAGDVGEFNSLLIDGDGDPVVSYYDATNGDLKLLRCTNALCEANVAPEANAGSDVVTVVGAPVFFTGSATDANGDVLSYSWEMGDGTVVDGTLTPSHIYTAAGVYTVTLTVTDEGGLQDSDSLTVTVGGEAVYLPVFRK